MRIKNFNLPLGLAAILAIALIGYKDTGIFVNRFNAKLDSGIELNFDRNDRAHIVGEGVSKTTYKVIKDGNTVYIPKDVLLKVDNGVKSYKVLNNTAILDENTEESIRLLFLDEVLEIIEDNEKFAKVRTADGTVGLVNKADLLPDRDRINTEGYSKVCKTYDNGFSTLKVNEGDEVTVAWFENDYYILLDENGNKFNAPYEDISIFKKVNSKAKSIAQPQEEIEVSENAEDVESFEDSEKKEIVRPVFKDNTDYLRPSDIEGTVLQMVEKAESLVGTPYVYGDTGEEGYDCSGLTYTLYKDIAGIKIPRVSKDQANFGVQVAKDELKPGDLLFFDSTKSPLISHVGFYIGNGLMIHASSSNSGIVESSISENYYEQRFVIAKRILF